MSDESLTKRPLPLTISQLAKLAQDDFNQHHNWEAKVHIELCADWRAMYELLNKLCELRGYAVNYGAAIDIRQVLNLLNFKP